MSICTQRHPSPHLGQQRLELGQGDAALGIGLRKQRLNLRKNRLEREDGVQQFLKKEAAAFSGAEIHSAVWPLAHTSKPLLPSVFKLMLSTPSASSPFSFRWAVTLSFKFDVSGCDSACASLRVAEEKQV